MTDRLRQEVIEKIAKNGRVYSINEAKAMAEELIELRKKLNEPTPEIEPYNFNPYAGYIP